MHQLVVVENAGSSVVRVKSFDLNSHNLAYKLKSVPDSGSIFQLSQVFSSYGYEPKAGVQILAAETTVTGSNNRIYYQRPSPDAVGVDKWDTFNFIVVSEDGVSSYEGTVTLVPPSGAIAGSSFLLGSEVWTIEGNKAASSAATFEPYSRGALLNHYVLGADDKINVQSAGAADQSLWYFRAPAKYEGNLGISYGGSLEFTLSSFSGDFSASNGDDVNVVLLECAECDGPVGKGITLGYPISALNASPNGAFDGSPLRVSIPLKEGTATGWVKDSQNSLQAWGAASKCDLIQVLSRLSKVRVLGDWTPWHETVALDDVQLRNTKGQLPICAMSRPDASICTC